MTFYFSKYCILAREDPGICRGDAGQTFGIVLGGGGHLGHRVECVGYTASPVSWVHYCITLNNIKPEENSGVQPKEPFHHAVKKLSPSDRHDTTRWRSGRRGRTALSPWSLSSLPHIYIPTQVDSIVPPTQPCAPPGQVES